MKQRSIHLDFHTSPWIKNVGDKFDPQLFAKTMKKSHVENVNLFSKCHHGMAYYPSKICPRHPHLRKGLDLMGEMIEALKKEQINATIYTTVAWEEHLAHKHPEWRQVCKDGSFAEMHPSPDGKTIQPGKWKFLDFAFTEYQKYFESHLTELLENYQADGYFIDILFYYQNATWSDACLNIRDELGLKGDTMLEHYQVEYYAQVQFASKMTQLIKSYQPHATIFYNTPNNRYVDANTGVLGKTKYQTHIEIESLPTGFWGYHHFPRNGRHLRTKNKKWLSMTGKFQKMWGDFGGLKPQAALEYECLKPQAMGGGVTVGDQLHPNGDLDRSTYDLIRKVFAQVKQAEPYYQEAKFLKEIGVVTPNHISKNEIETGKSEEGIIQLLETLHYEVDVLDDDSEFDDYRLIILPDEVVITKKLQLKLDNYQKKYGKLLLSFNSIFDENGNNALTFLPLTYVSQNNMQPTYWKAREIFKGNEFDSIRVIYNEGANVTSDLLDTWVDRINPYFKRSELRFSSHFQAPPNAKADYPAILGNDKFVYIADPIFKEYRQTGNYFIKICFKEILDNLIGKPLYGYGLSPNVFKSALRVGNDLIITLLYYIPTRQAIEQDIIEQSQNLYGEELQLKGYAGVLNSVLDDVNLKSVHNKYTIHNAKGRVILKAANFFEKSKIQSSDIPE